MNLSRNDSRMLAMTILYQFDLFNRKKIGTNIEELIDNNLVDINDSDDFVKTLVNGVIENDSKLVDIANGY